MNISLKSQIERAPCLHRVRAISSKELSWSLPIILSSFYSCSFSLWPNKMPADMENHFWYTIHTKKAFVPQSSTKIKRPKLLRSVKCNFFFVSFLSTVQSILNNSKAGHLCISWISYRLWLFDVAFMLAIAFVLAFDAEITITHPNGCWLFRNTNPIVQRLEFTLKSSK